MLLQARGLCSTRPGDDGPRDVLCGLDVDVAAGTLTDLTGPSGCGKTTLLLALARLLPGASGSLALDGVPAAEIDPNVWRTRVAYLPQVTSLAPGSVADNLLLPWRLKVRRGSPGPAASALRTALDGVGMSDVALDRDSGRLSVGQAARIALLRVVLTVPSVLLLDEPDASLDDESAAHVARITEEFAAAGGAVVRVRHARVDAAAHRRLRLADGRLEEVTA
jgi:ABC-type iron transport system FetAB ATPase subunit